jgi:hypothetical protein
VPDIRLGYNGAAFTFSAEQRIYTNPDVRFWFGSSPVTTRDDAEATLTTFVETVLDRLRSKGVGETSAALRWARVRASRADADETAFCEAAGALRLDLYQIDDTAARAIEQAADLFEGEALTELLAGARLANCLSLLDWIKAVERRPPEKSRVADLQHAADAVAAKAPDRVSEESWARGYRRARALRAVLGFNDTQHFATFIDLSTALVASRQYALAPSANGIRLLRSHKAGEAHLHLRTHGRSAAAQASHLFTFARGVGDVACCRNPQRAPVNELRSAYRQAAGRAFAAEFLAPVNEVLSMRDDGRDTVSIAEAFAVSAEVIEREIENAQRIEADCAATRSPSP